MIDTLTEAPDTGTNTAERMSVEQPVQEVKRKGTLRAAAILMTIVAAAAGGCYYFNSLAYESTDNAFIEGGVIQVSPKVSGQVMRVPVQDNQHVNKGDLIVEIDSRDYDARAAEARARLADIMARAQGAESNLQLTSAVTTAVLTQARAAADAASDQIQMRQAHAQQDQFVVRAAEAALLQAEAQESAAAAEATRASGDMVRYRALYAKDEVSKQVLDRAEALAKSATATQEAGRQAIESAKANLAQARAAQSSTLASLHESEKLFRQAQGKVSEALSGPEQVQIRRSDIGSLAAQVEQQRAAVAQAELAVSYTRIYAPESGYITKKSIETGNYVQAGQPLTALVPDRLWVIANFKETQLTLMRPGQPVTLQVDAFPQLKLHGRVESIQSGTGSRFSLLPAENATGNYVKVVQRVPVKIVFTDAPPVGYRLGPGMSVTPEVKVK